jgi:hypothetical protein
MTHAAVRRLASSLAGILMFAFSFRLAAQSTAARPTTPRSGTEVLEAMHAAYAGKWYHTLRFVQKTTLRRPDGSEAEQTWYETLRHTPATGVQLRIDFGDLAAGNGALFTADSTYRVRGGRAEDPVAHGNEFLPLIEGVYVQPVQRTVRELGQMKVDLSRVRSGTWEGKPVWIVGATSAADTTSPQFWVDTDRKLLVRMVIAPDASRPPLDVHLGGYTRTGGGWLATRIEMFQGGVRRQAEEYSNWKVDVPVDAALFDLSRWTTAPHWAKTAK